MHCITAARRVELDYCIEFIKESGEERRGDENSKGVCSWRRSYYCIEFIKREWGRAKGG